MAVEGDVVVREKDEGRRDVARKRLVRTICEWIRKRPACRRAVIEVTSDRLYSRLTRGAISRDETRCSLRHQGTNSGMYTLSGSPMGRPPVAKSKAKSNLDISTEEGQLKLLRALAKGEALTSPSKEKPIRYMPIFKHPLPPSDHSSFHDLNYRRATCCALDRQIAAAVTMGDAWVVEELCMQGAPTSVPDKNGFTPLHLAVQSNLFECLMVLINAGAKINAITISGVTPLFLAVASGAKQCASILRENGGVMEIDLSGEAPPIPALVVSLPTTKTWLDKFDDRANTFKRHTMY